jgi:hypothetical protein
MEHFIQYLKEYEITDPLQIHGIACLILDAADDRQLWTAAEDISRMDEDQIELVLQQVLGGS